MWVRVRLGSQKHHSNTFEAGAVKDTFGEDSVQQAHLNQLIKVFHVFVLLVDHEEECVNLMDELLRRGWGEGGGGQGNSVISIFAPFLNAGQLSWEKCFARIKLYRIW